MDIFQVNTKLVAAARSQAVHFVQSEPKLAVQIAKAPFVAIPSAEKIYRTVISLLKHRPSSTGNVVATLLNVRKHIFYFPGVLTSVEIVVIDTTMWTMFRIVIGSCWFRRQFCRVRKCRQEKTEEKNFTEIFHRESTSENLLQVQVITITDPLKEWFFNTEPSL